MGLVFTSDSAVSLSIVHKKGAVAFLATAPLNH